MDVFTFYCGNRWFSHLMINPNMPFLLPLIFQKETYVCGKTWKTWMPFSLQNKWRWLNLSLSGGKSESQPNIPTCPCLFTDPSSLDWLPNPLSPVERTSIALLKEGLQQSWISRQLVTVLLYSVQWQSCHYAREGKCLWQPFGGRQKGPHLCFLLENLKNRSKAVLKHYNVVQDSVLPGEFSLWSCPLDGKWAKFATDSVWASGSLRLWPMSDYLFIDCFSTSACLYLLTCNKESSGTLKPTCCYGAFGAHITGPLPLRGEWPSYGGFRPTSLGTAVPMV